MRSLRKNTIFGLALIAVFAFLITYFSAYGILKKVFYEANKRDLEVRMQRAKYYIQNELDNLDNIAENLTHLNYICLEIAKERILFDSFFLSNEFLEDNKLNMIAVFNRNGLLLEKKAYDFDYKNELAFPQSVQKYMAPDGVFFKKGSNSKGLVILPEGLLLLAAKPIVFDSQSSKSDPRFIIGHFLKRDDLQKFARQEGISAFGVERFDSLYTPEDVRNALRGISDESNLFLRQINSGGIAGYSILKDIEGKPLFVITIELRRSFTSQLAQVFEFALKVISFDVFIFFLIIVVFLNRTIFSKFKSILCVLGDKIKKANISQSVDVGRLDEINMISRGINDLYACEEFYRNKLDEIGQILLAVNEGGEDRIFFWNIKDGSLIWLGVPVEERQLHADRYPGVISEWTDLIHPDDRERVVSNLQEALKFKAVRYKEEYRIHLKDGIDRLIISQAKIIRDNEGNAVKLAGIIRDITEQKDAENKAKLIQERLIRIYNFSPSAMGLSTFDEGRYVDINDSFTRILGYSQEEVIGKSSLELNIWVGAEQRKALIEKLKKQGSVVDQPVEMRAKSGKIISFLISAAIIIIQGKWYVFLSAYDVTRYKEITETLRSREDFLRGFLDAMFDMVARVDTNLCIEYVNPSNYKVLGYTPEQMLGKNVFEFIHPDDLVGVKSYFERKVSEKSSGILCLRFRHADGHYLYVESTGSIIYNDKNEIQGFVFVSREVKDKKNLND